MLVEFFYAKMITNQAAIKNVEIVNEKIVVTTNSDLGSNESYEINLSDKTDVVKFGGEAEEVIF